MKGGRAGAAAGVVEAGDRRRRLLPRRPLIFVTRKR
jgi:hypothetical protein